MKHLIIKWISIAGLGLLIAGCGSSGTTYSLLSTGQSFKQAKSGNSKIDMLWVVDNSGSMLPLQNNMTSNFNAFISQFVTKGYDFHLAVTSSDSYRAGAQFANQPNLARFSDGIGSHTGVFDIMPSTPNLINTFVTNASLGANGSGDERAFSSFKAALNSPLNAGFLRSDSFMAVIILSDEDDFSNPNRPEYSWTFHNGIADQNYNDPGLESVDSYVSYLDTLTNSTGATRRYSASAITVLDNACRQQHAQSSPSTLIGQRYIDLANKTDGVLGSMCDVSYAPALQAIQNRIIELGTQFFLTVPPVESSIVVKVNGVNIPVDPSNGYTYNSAANSIVFHGAAIPPAGADIMVSFDPSGLHF